MAGTAGRPPAQRARSSPTSRATCRTRGCRPTSRSTATTAGRLGVTPAAIDNALYNAFGQRLISTIFTQSNQYRVVLEVKPEFRSGPAALDDLYVTSAVPGQPPQQVPLALGRAGRRSARRRSSINHIGQFPAATISFNLAPRRLARRRGEGDRGGARRSSACRPACSTNFQGAALAFRASLANTLLLILAAIVTMYIVLGVLYESYIHPVTILSTLPSAGVGALLALMRRRQRPRHHRDHRHHPADRHRQEERDHDDRLRARRRARRRAWRRATRSTRRACCASGRS